MTTTRLIIYYDGLCHLCSREINHYRHRTDDSVQYVDIMQEDFDPELHGVDAKAVHKTMHARLDGELNKGVDAFLAIWSVVPGYRWLNRIVSLPGIYHLAKPIYSFFAWLRPYLPRRKAACETGSCKV
jgi:predicted DCC family thiol-disulfide oxidoreductase YuxK